MQTLKVIRESLSSLTDDDLVEAQGGEVKFVALAVGVGAAAAVAGGICCRWCSCRWRASF